jgi:hypothetical protein
MLDWKRPAIPVPGPVPRKVTADIVAVNFLRNLRTFDKPPPPKKLQSPAGEH